MIEKQKRGVRTMTYNKPEIVSLVSAVSAVKGQVKPSTIVFDNGDDRLSAAAYESDE